MHKFALFYYYIVTVHDIQVQAVVFSVITLPSCIVECFKRLYYNIRIETSFRIVVGTRGIRVASPRTRVIFRVSLKCVPIYAYRGIRILYIISSLDRGRTDENLRARA